MGVRIAILGDSPCDRCVAACCRQSGHEFAVLLRGDDEKRRFAAWAKTVTIRSEEGRVSAERVLPYVDGRCQFLGDDDRCRIYQDRPGACRAFQCIEHFAADGPGRHGRFLRFNPHVLGILSSL